MDALLDTHAWVWSMLDAGRLSSNAVSAINSAKAVRVSPISIFEITQKVRVGKWPEMAPYASTLADQIAAQGAISAPFTNEIAYFSAALAWDHRDPFDRILAATAILTGTALISADSGFDTLNDSRLQRIW